MLVPEIALTPQALARFEARFGGLVAVLHSGLPPGERYDEWETLAAGEARVCAATRRMAARCTAKSMSGIGHN